MAKRIQYGWAIASDHGLYVGWHFRRMSMIAQHVSEVQSASEPAISPFIMSGSLSVQQSNAWQKCRKRGDRAVKVAIHYTGPESSL